MGLEVIDFTQQKKVYKFEAGEFTLKPPYMSVVSQASGLIKEIEEAGKNSKEFTPDEFKRIAYLQIQILNLILEETNKGKFEDITLDNFRADVAQKIMQDFFQQFNK